MMTPGQVMVPRQVTISEEVTTPGQMATSASLSTSLLTRVPAPALLGKKVKGWTQVGSGAQLACPLALVMPSHQPTSRSSVGGGGFTLALPPIQRPGLTLPTAQKRKRSLQKLSTVPPRTLVGGGIGTQNL